MATTDFSTWANGAPVVQIGYTGDFSAWAGGAPVVCPLITVITVTETATGVETPTIGLSETETASGVDAGTVAVSVSETAAGVEVPSVTVAGPSESASGDETASVAATTSETETASGADADAVGVPETETATGTEAASVEVTTPDVVETATGVETPTISLSETESATGADVPSVTKTVELGFDLFVRAVSFKHLGFDTHVSATVAKTLGFDCFVATDVFTTELGFDCRVLADSQATLGFDCVVMGGMEADLAFDCFVARPEEATLGFDCFVSAGPVLLFECYVARTESVTLGFDCVVGRLADGAFYAGQGLPGRFLPDPDRSYTDYGLTPLDPTEAAVITGGETAYLVMLYSNFPNPAGKGSAAWIFSNCYLPVNAASCQFDEPVKETVFDTLGARTLVVSESELDTPRITRARKFTFEFPPVGIQFVKWFQTKMRVAEQFNAEIRLFDQTDDFWEEAYTDPTDDDPNIRYWGTLPSWKGGTARVRVNGSIVSSGYTVLTGLGAVDFDTERDPDDLVELQYVWAPRLRVLGVEPQPKPGTIFGKFLLRVVLQEIL